MTPRTSPFRPNARGAFLALAALAVALKVLIPAGFMTPAQGAPLSLVLCTAQGAKLIAPPVTEGDHGSGGQLDHDSPCAFAGHGTGAAPPSPLASGAVEFVVFRPAQVAALVDLAPGRGLSAPPLPARGPPGLTT